MRIVFAGTPESATPVLKYLMESEHQVVAVLSKPAAKRGRGRKLTDSPVAKLAKEVQLPLFTPKTLRDPAQRPDLASLKADLAVVVAYGQIIPADLLDIFPFGWLNMHYSLLPKFRGASPVEHTILAGEEITGVSLFRIDEGLDTGPLYAVDPIRIAPDATTELLLNQLTRHGCQLLPHVLQAMQQGTVRTFPQNTSQEVTYAGLLRKSDARIPWDQDAKQVDRVIRAFTSQPGAWTVLPDGKRISLRPVLVTDQDTLQPGQVRIDRHEVSVGTATNDVKLIYVTPAGKKEMAADAWARGLRFGETFFFDSESEN